jgi:hypothetical protein
MGTFSLHVLLAHVERVCRMKWTGIHIPDMDTSSLYGMLAGVQ